MLRGLIILIQVVLLIMLLRSDFAQYFLEDAQATVGSWFETVASVPDRQKLSALREGFLYNNLSLQPHQTDYIFQITESVEQVRHFNSLYCEGNDKNPFIFGANLAKLCSDISATTLLVKL